MAINRSITIMASVGRGGRNQRADVSTVQERLNALMGPSRQRLAVDGLSGPKTEGMIGDFQRNVVGFQWPDRRVDPAGQTIRALNDPNSANVWQRASVTPPLGGGGQAPAGPPQKGPLSIYDCAEMSSHVYFNFAGGKTAAGWTGGQLLGGTGFAAKVYTRNGVTVVAYRGTDDFRDVIEDIQMVPLLELGMTATALVALLEEYKANAGWVTVPAVMLEGIAQSPRMRLATHLFLNRVPAQVAQAQAVLNQAGDVDYLTGHSLGGALAKVVASRNAIPSINFNSPFMGGLQGMPQISTPYITSVNAKGDPLSLATGAVGNHSHGQCHTVQVPPFRGRVPQSPDLGPGWLDFVSPGLAAMLRARDVGAYLGAFALHVAKAAGHYHSIDRLRDTLRAMPRFNRDLLGP